MDCVVFFCAMLLVALIGAGIWYFSESLIQLYLYRFSIFPKLLACIGAQRLWRLDEPGGLRP